MTAELVSIRRGVSYDVSDCVAMDEAGEWVSYPDHVGRAGAMAAAARSQFEVGYGSWQETLEHFAVRRAWMRPAAESGYWWFTAKCDPEAVAVWVVGTKGWFAACAQTSQNETCPPAGWAAS